MKRSSLTLLVNAPLEEDQRERIRDLGVHLLDGVSEESLRVAEVIYTTDIPFKCRQAPRLRWIQLNAAGVDHIVTSSVATEGVPIATARGAYSVAVAELAVGMILALSRRFPTAHSLQFQKRWPDDFAPLRGENSYARVLSIIGYGSIGRHLARIVSAMGMRVLACKRSPERKKDEGFFLPHTGDPEGLFPEQWYDLSRIREMFSLSDIVVICLPLTPDTRRLIGHSELAGLPRNAYLINVGRGGILDEEALVDMLKRRRIAGAALDVFREEPLPAENPFWDLPNTIVLPHIGSYTREQGHLAGEVLIENLSRDLSQRPLINLFDRERGY